MFNIINFILILILAWMLFNSIITGGDDTRQLIKYVKKLEKQLESQARAQEKIVEALSQIDKDLENEKHLRETDYSNTMNGLFNLSNDINRAKMRVARIEQESKFPFGYANVALTPGIISNEDVKKQMLKNVEDD